MISCSPTELLQQGIANFLFAGAEMRTRVAALYTLLETAKLNGINPEAYLHRVLERLATLPGNRLAELLPWNYVQSVD